MERSAGGVLYTVIRGRRMYVVVTELDGHCGLPKGHLEPGEQPRQTALREIREETGIRAALYQDFEAVEEYDLPHGGSKMVTYYLAVYSRQALKPDPGQVRGVRLLPFAQALGALAFPGAKRVLRQAEDYLAAQPPQEKNIHRKSTV